MKIYISVKSLAKKRNYISKKELILSKNPTNLRELIIEIVTENVKQFNEKKLDTPLVNYLTKADIELQSTTGKVGFGAKYNEKKADVEEALNVAFQAFEDGLYKVFVREEDIEDLDTPLVVEENDEIAFIKFTMLAGRMW